MRSVSSKTSWRSLVVGKVGKEILNFVDVFGIESGVVEMTGLMLEEDM